MSFKVEKIKLNSRNSKRNALELVFLTKEHQINSFYTHAGHFCVVLKRYTEF